MNNPYQQTHPPVGTSNWFWTLLVLNIPILNIILVIYWALSSDTNPSKRNLCRAVIAWVVLAILFVAVFAVLALILGQSK